MEPLRGTVQQQNYAQNINMQPQHSIPPNQHGMDNSSQIAGRKRPLSEVSMAPAGQINQYAAMANANNNMGGHSAPPNRGYNASNVDSLRASKRDLNWDLQYEALVAFANSYGHCNVRSGYNADSDDRSQINLYAWLALQRRHRKGGKLRKDREDKLQVLVDQGKLTWVGSDSKNDDEDLVQPPPPPPPSWNSYLGALLAYLEDFGHANVPPGHMSFIERRRSLDLGAWVRLQRQLMANGKLQESHKQKLNILVEAAVFSWTAPASPVATIQASVLDATWDLQFDAVNEYATKHGNCNVTEPGTVLSTSFGTSFDLGLWVLCQRSRYKLRSLAPTRLERLHGLIQKGLFAWMSPEEAMQRAEDREKKRKEEETLWNAWYNVLVWYGRHNGHCNLGATDTVSLPDESEAELGKWLDIQKRYLSKGKLKPDRVEKLRRLVDEHKLPMEWIAEYPQLSQQGSRDASGTTPPLQHQQQPQPQQPQQEQPQQQSQQQPPSLPVDSLTPAAAPASEASPAQVQPTEAPVQPTQQIELQDQAVV